MNMDALCPRCFKESFVNGYCSSCCYFSGEQRNPVALPKFSFLKNRYLIGEVLGAGGFGITYLALDTLKNLRCAIKECFPSEIATRSGDGLRVTVTGDNSEDFEYGKKKFFEEAEILSELLSVYSIVNVLDFFYENQTAYMVMEFIEGVNLKKVSQANFGTTAVSSASTVLKEIGKALSEVHKRGLLHRDVSPDNIIIRTDGSAKLIDFGAARNVLGNKSKSLTVVLKPGYAPPEQYSSSGKQGPWTDIYALACTVYFFLTGKKVQDSMSRLGSDSVLPLHKARTDIPKRFSDIIAKAMELDFRKRYQSLEELLKDLDKYESDIGLIAEKIKSAVSSAETASAAQFATNEPVVKVSFWQRIKEFFLKVFTIESAESEMLFAQMISGPLEGWLFEFSPNKILSFGRSSQYSNAVIEDNSLSRLHCTVWFNEQDKRLYIQDFSSNGTFRQNGERLQKEIIYPLEMGEIFYLAKTDYSAQIIKITQGE